MKKLILTVSTVLLITSLAFSQDSTSVKNSTVTNISDNLGRTISSRAIYKGSLSTRLGFGYSEFKIDDGHGDSYNSRDITAPHIMIGYGITKNIDVHISTNIVQSDWDNTNDSSFLTGSNYRIRGYFIGSKVNLWKQKGWLPEVAFDLGVGLPSDFKLIKSNVSATLAFSYKIGEKLHLGGNVNMYSTFYEVNTETEVQNSFGFSLNIRYEFIHGFGAFADLDLNGIRVNSYIPSNYTPNGGLYYRINPNMQIELSAGKFLSTGYSPTTFGYVSGGFNWLLFNK